MRSWQKEGGPPRTRRCRGRFWARGQLPQSKRARRGLRSSVRVAQVTAELPCYSAGTPGGKEDEATGHPERRRRTLQEWPRTPSSARTLANATA